MRYLYVLSWFIIVTFAIIGFSMPKVKGFKYQLKKCDAIYINLYELSFCDTVCLSRIDFQQQVCIIGNMVSIINHDTCLLDSLDCIGDTDDTLMKYFYKKYIIYGSAEYGYIVAIGLKVLNEKSVFVSKNNTIIKVGLCEHQGSISTFCYSYKEFLLDNIWYFDSVERYKDTLQLRGFKSKDVFLNILLVKGRWALAVLDTLQFPDSANNKFWIRWYDEEQQRLAGEPVVQF